MTRESKKQVSVSDFGKEKLGQRIARLRKDRGHSQAELSQKMGINQKIISDYELCKLRPHPEMIIKLALALNVSADEILGLQKMKSTGAGNGSDRKILRRIKQIEALSPSQQKFVLRTLDSLIKAAKTE